jgi:hypothetical protein
MQWEYYRLATVESCLDEALKELGKDGWELVSVMPEARLFHGFQCILKRPVAPADPSRRASTPPSSRFNKILNSR